MRMTTVILLLALTSPAVAHDCWHDDVCCDREHPASSKEDEAWHRYDRGLHLAHDHDLDDAVKALREAIELAPDIGLYHLTLGHVLADMGKKQEAITELRIALRKGRGGEIEDAYHLLRELGDRPGSAYLSRPSGALPAADAEGRLKKVLEKIRAKAAQRPASSGPPPAR